MLIKGKGRVQQVQRLFCSLTACLAGGHKEACARSPNRTVNHPAAAPASRRGAMCRRAQKVAVTAARSHVMRRAAPAPLGMWRRAARCVQTPR